MRDAERLSWTLLGKKLTECADDELELVADMIRARDTFVRNTGRYFGEPGADFERVLGLCCEHPEFSPCAVPALSMLYFKAGEKPYASLECLGCVADFFDIHLPARWRSIVGEEQAKVAALCEQAREEEAMEEAIQSRVAGMH
jgi:hypothetical protein